MTNLPHDPNCLFCKIIAGKIPCHRVLETDSALAFLDIGPLSPGHTLVIPKAHAVTLDQLGDDDAAACLAVVPRIARAVLKATGATHWNLLQNNGTPAHQVVMHVHFHIIPKHEGQHDSPASGGDGLGILWHTQQLASSDAALLAASIAQRMDDRATAIDRVE